MREFSSRLLLEIDCTAVLQNLAKNSNVNFSACVKLHVENEWEILRMCEIDV